MLNTLTDTQTELVLAGPAPTKKQVRELEQFKALFKDLVSRSKRKAEGHFISETLRITPLIAEWLLAETNIGNRTLREGRSDTFAQTIQGGNFQTTSQGISFTRDSQLNNGQHRLDAIKKSGKAVNIFCVFGENRDAFFVHDSQMGVRGGADILRIMGHEYTSSLSVMARIYHLISTKRYSGGAGATAPNYLIKKIVDDNPEMVVSAAVGQAVCSKFRCSSAPGGLLHFFIQRDSKVPDRAEEFFGRLIDGDGLKASSSIFQLREALLAKRLADSERQHTARIVAQTAAMVIAWNYWLAERRATARSLSWTAAEFPMAD